MDPCRFFGVPSPQHRNLVSLRLSCMLQLMHFMCFVCLLPTEIPAAFITLLLQGMGEWVQNCLVGVPHTLGRCIARISLTKSLSCRS